jgi:hypothetical protein
MIQSSVQQYRYRKPPRKQLMSTIAALKKKTKQTNQINEKIAKLQAHAHGINTEIMTAARQKQFAFAISLQKKYEKSIKKVDLMYLQEQNTYAAKAELLVQMGKELGVMVEVKPTTTKTKKNQSSSATTLLVKAGLDVD